MRSRRFSSLALAAGLSCLGRPALADEGKTAPGRPGPGTEPEATKEAEPTVGWVKGDKVNLRVGPRVDDCAVTQLEQGTTVVIVERSGEWLGVRVPAGFSAAVATRLTEPVDSDHVRIAATDVNLRVRPPQGERAYPAFRDKPALGAVLPVVDREGDWTWVEAPEEVRGYLHAQFVAEAGPLSANAARVEAGRDARKKREEVRASLRKRAQEDGDEAALRGEVGAVSGELLKARAAGGYDTAPIALLADRLASSVEAHPAAAPRTRALAKSVAEDLEREMQIRVAFADDILARKRAGRPPPDLSAPPAPSNAAVDVTGFVRWEPTPSGAGGGAFVLWSGSQPTDRPTHVIRWSSGDLAAFDGRSVRVKGKAMGGRLIGLPTVEVDSVVPLPP
jgi:hypothetical protein